MTCWRLEFKRFACNSTKDSLAIIAETAKRIDRYSFLEQHKYEMLNMMTTILILTATCALPISLILIGWTSRAPTRDRGPSRHALRRAIVGQTFVFGVVYFGVLLWGIGTVNAQGTPAAAPDSSSGQVTSGSRGLSVGDGLGMLAVALATSVSVLGASYAVAVVGVSRFRSYRRET